MKTQNEIEVLKALRKKADKLDRILNSALYHFEEFLRDIEEIDSNNFSEELTDALEGLSDSMYWLEEYDTNSYPGYIEILLKAEIKKLTPKKRKK